MGLSRDARSDGPPLDVQPAHAARGRRRGQHLRLRQVGSPIAPGPRGHTSAQVTQEATPDASRRWTLTQPPAGATESQEKRFQSQAAGLAAGVGGEGASGLRGGGLSTEHAPGKASGRGGSLQPHEGTLHSANLMVTLDQGSVAV